MEAEDVKAALIEALQASKNPDAHPHAIFGLFMTAVVYGLIYVGDAIIGSRR